MLGLITLAIWCIHMLVIVVIKMDKRPKLQLGYNIVGGLILVLGIIVTYLGTLQPSTVDIAVTAGTSALILSVWLLLVGLLILYL